MNLIEPFRTQSWIELDQFHFIRPEWLWALPALFLLWFFIGKLGRSTRWQSFIARDKLEALKVAGGRYSQVWHWLLILGWTLATLAAAGPAWKQVPVPTVRDESALVIVLDLSRSMLAQDVNPDRLTRTKYKLIDILRMRGDGQTALVAYAGDPHTLSPLTDDPGIIEALLPALHPNVMPVQGSNTEAAIDLSMQLLKDAGLVRGDILLLTDGVAPDAQKYIRDRFDGSFSLSILGIGSTDAVPIPREGGGFFTDTRGEIILSRLNRDELQILAGASNGRYVELQPDESDIKYLLQDRFERSKNPEDSDGHENALLYDSWEDMGYWLVLLILPFAALGFRKGVIYALPLMFCLPMEARALSLSEVWDGLWLTKDQQGAKLMEEKSPEAAAAKFKRQDWAGVADFDAGNYASAAERFSKTADMTSTYNRGTALAFNGDLAGAIAAYDEVLAEQPDHEDAAYNKALVEQIVRRQKQQQQDQSGEQPDEKSQEQSAGQRGQGSEQDSEQQQSDRKNQDEASREQRGGENPESGRRPQEQQEASDQETGQQKNEGQTSAESKRASGREQHQEPDRPTGEELAAQMAPAEATPDKLEDASEQWLRAIPDDPGGLLRRKFDYEYRQHQLEKHYRLQMPASPDDERY